MQGVFIGYLHGMRPSANRHVLAVLRKTLDGMHQHELASLVGCSVETIRRIEKGPLKLSKSLAQRISTATGVSLDWLITGDIKTPPYSELVPTYDVHFYRLWASTRDTPLPPDLIEYLPDAALALYVQLRGVLAAAALRGENYASHVLAEVSRTLADAKKQFGSVPAFGNHDFVREVTGEGLWIIENDVLLARKHHEDESRFLKGTALKPSPTKADLDTYRLWRAQHELSVASDARGGSPPPSSE